MTLADTGPAVRHKTHGTIQSGNGNRRAGIKDFLRGKRWFFDVSSPLKFRSIYRYNRQSYTRKIWTRPVDPAA